MNILYEEKLTSTKTQILFVVLTLVFITLTYWRTKVFNLDVFAMTTFFFAIFFLFYTLSYKSLIIRISEEKVKLRFGIFSWTVPSSNIESCELDNNLPWMMKYGGAGIHFMMVHGRYRVSFNFLEHDRVVIRLKEKRGWVRDVSFSTKHSKKIMRIFNQGEP